MRLCYMLAEKVLLIEEKPGALAKPILAGLELAPRFHAPSQLALLGSVYLPENPPVPTMFNL